MTLIEDINANISEIADMLSISNKRQLEIIEKQDELNERLKNIESFLGGFSKEG